MIFFVIFLSVVGLVFGRLEVDGFGLEGDLVQELNAVEKRIGNLRKKIKAKKTLDDLMSYSNHHRSLNHNFYRFFEKKVQGDFEYFRIVKGFSSKYRNLDIYGNAYVLLANKKELILMDFSGGVLLNKTFERNVKLISFTQDSLRKLPKVFLP
jgi:hypothetical protein